MIREAPYFMINREWYEFVQTENGSRMVLTDAAPQEAIDSYNKWKNTKPRQDVVLDLEDDT